MMNSFGILISLRQGRRNALLGKGKRFLGPTLPLEYKGLSTGGKAARTWSWRLVSNFWQV